MAAEVTGDAVRYQGRPLLATAIASPCHRSVAIAQDEALEKR